MLVSELALAVVLVLAVEACRGGGATPPLAEASTPDATTADTRPAAPDRVDAATSDAVGPAPAPGPADAGARASSPVRFRAFTRGAPKSPIDRVSARKPEPDGEPDTVFVVTVEGDYVTLTVACPGASWAASTSRSELDTRPPPPRGPIVPGPLPARAAPWTITKHVPVLFPFEKDVLVAWDAEGKLALVDGRARTLHLHAFAVSGLTSCTVHAERPDGTWATGPTLR